MLIKKENKSYAFKFNNSYYWRNGVLWKYLCSSDFGKIQSEKDYYLF